MAYILLPIVVVLGYFGKKYFEGGTCNSLNSIKGKIVFITGSNTGIGATTAIELAKRGGTIVMGCRDLTKAKEVVNQIERIGVKPYLLKLDLSDLKQIEECVDEFKKLNLGRVDILINNAGVMATLKREFTKQGIELQMGTNYVGHFYLTKLLTPFLKNADKPRVINVASTAHQLSSLDVNDLNSDRNDNALWQWRGTWITYGNSKLANILHAQEFGKRYGIKAVSVHPGVVRTELMREQLQNKFFAILFKIIQLPWVYFTKNQLQGSQTTIQCAVEDYDKLVDGAYYSDCAQKVVAAKYTSNNIGQKLWEQTDVLHQKLI